MEVRNRREQLTLGKRCYHQRAVKSGLSPFTNSRGAQIEKGAFPERMANEGGGGGSVHEKERDLDVDSEKGEESRQQEHLEVYLVGES